MNAVAAARGVGLLVEHLVPRGPFFGSLSEKRVVGTWRKPVEQHGQRWTNRADNSKRYWGSPAECKRSLVDLDHAAVLGQKVRIGIVCAEHQQKVGASYCVDACLTSD